MCPIVPTFTCGLLRSNFSFAIFLCFLCPSSTGKVCCTFHAETDPATPAWSNKTRAFAPDRSPSAPHTTAAPSLHSAPALGPPAPATFLDEPVQNRESELPCAATDEETVRQFPGRRL